MHLYPDHSVKSPNTTSNPWYRIYRIFAKCLTEIYKRLQPDLRTPVVLCELSDGDIRIVVVEENGPMDIPVLFLLSLDEKSEKAELLISYKFNENAVCTPVKLGTDPLWNARLLLSEEGRMLIEKAHVDYLEAGCDILTTASYQAFVPTADVPSTVSSDIDLMSLFPLAMKVARTAVEKSGKKNIRIAASMGSYGAVLANGAEYHGNFGGITWDSLVVFHQMRIETILKTDPDLLAFETVPTTFESTAIMRALEQCAIKNKIPPAWISFSNATESRECAATVKDSPHIFAVGVNCVKPELVEGILRVYKEVLDGSGKELLCYPNKGETWDAVGREWVENSGVDSADVYAELAETWIAAGASLI
ncbi:UNVERIFIED_CONTAM: hypothetical protein HDU68_006618, partial [Siphonaria sp. JEL0065]